MHNVGARLRARAALSSSGERVRVRQRCFSIFADGRASQCLLPRPRRHNNVVPAHITNTPPKRNASRESPRVSAVTDDDFPRVLNGPAPGYAEVALRALLFGAQPVGDGEDRNDRTAMTSEEALVNGVAMHGARTDGAADGMDPFLESRRALGDPPFRHHERQRQQQRVNLRVNGRTSMLEDLAQPPQQPPSRAFSSELALEEEEDEVSWESREAVGEENKRTERPKLPYNTLWAMQVEREGQSHEEACAKYSKMFKQMTTMGKGTHMKPVQALLLTWYPALKKRIETEQAAVWANLPDDKKDDVARKGAFGGRNTYGPLLVMLKADKQAVLVMHEVVNLALANGNKGVSTITACRRVAELVMAEVNLLKAKGRNKRPLFTSHREVREVNKKAELAYDSLDYAAWPMGAQVKLGAALIRFLLETACWTEDGEDGVAAWKREGAEEAGVGLGKDGTPQPAFVHEVVKRGKKQQGSLSLAPEVYKQMVDEDISRLAAPRFVPMLVQPRDWTSPEEGGFLSLRTHIMRTKGDRGQKEALRKADLTRVYDGLNCLGKVRWRVNGAILDTVLTCLKEKIPVGDLPTADDLPLPPVPPGLKLGSKGRVVVPPAKDFEDPAKYDEVLKTASAYRRTAEKIKRKNANMHSIRCDMQIKVDVAEEFRDDIIYFPYNMDFRGRTYPIPPNLNILGSDFSRGVLMFDEVRPLGERGLYWLKVHLANLFGEDKLSFEDRVAFVDNHLQQIRDSALRPLEGKGWWKDADSPWQCLAVCKDLSAALECPDPAKYLSCLPVHQDGSCNGLQHYAALGLDAKGGAQVNLVPSPKPQDVYTGVCKVVIQKVAREARTAPLKEASDEEVERHRLAKMIDGLIDRKVVKQTVMTSVYGVTFVGARKQIQNILEERMTAGEGVPTEEAEKDAYLAAAYVAGHTMKVLEELFTEARNIMEWLMAVSALVAKEGQPMAWITPMGLPVLQPYRRKDSYQVQTLLQGVHLREETDTLPVAVPRQKSAFPPNFVHSLDSTHMLLTAVEMERASVPFAAVHDSYWVHAGNIDQMNEQLRQCFVNLYSGPILEELYDSLRMRYPTIDFPPIPARGSLKLEDVKDSKYFFN